MDKISLDFIGIGAEKSGTTWLADMLRQHPDVFLPEQKELHYFNEKFVEDPSLENYNSSKEVSWYFKFFEKGKREQKKGEFSPSYLWSEKAAGRIHGLFPNAKIIAILRDPAKRSFSQYLYYFQKGIIAEEDFLSAIKKHPYLIERSMYFNQIKKFIDVFGKDNVHVFLFEDLVKDRRGFLVSVERKLGLDEFIPKDIDKKSNVTGLPKNKLINRMLGRARIFFRSLGWNWMFDFARKTGIAQKVEKFRNDNKVLYQDKPELNESEKSYLETIFKKDINKLEDLLSIDLPNWKNGN